ncbi:DFP2-like protein, partial [Euroglyphus maynei]
MRSILGADIVQSPFEMDHSRRLVATTGVKHGNAAAISGQRRYKAAVRSKHTFEYRPVKIEQLQEQLEPKIIEVEARSLPLEIHFKSASSRIKMVQEHEKSELRQEQRTQSEEEPQRLYHLVRKPIIQEVREIITPYRRIVQEIQPVLEEIHTVISHGGQQHRHEDEQQLIGTDAMTFTRPTTTTTTNVEMEDDVDKFQRQTLKPATALSKNTVTRPKSNLMSNLENYVRAQQQQQQQQPLQSTTAGSVHQSTSSSSSPTPRRLMQTPISYDSSSYDTSEFERTQFSH